MPHAPQARPLLEEDYAMEDALLVGGLLIVLLSHAHRERVGTLAAAHCLRCTSVV